MNEGLSEFIERQHRTKAGLSRADYQVLAHLSEDSDGTLRPFELARLLRWEKSRLSQHLGRMQKRGLVSRTQCETDQRGATISITPDGLDLIHKAAPLHVADVRNVLIDHLTREELATLTAIGDKVRGRLAELELELEPEHER